jgi:hypothetical protein
MGLGGHLIWSSALESIYLADQRAPVVCHKPKISDVILGYLYDRAVSLQNDIVFKNNPHLLFTTAVQKNPFIKFMDRCGDIILRWGPIKPIFENWIFKRSESAYRHGARRLAHVDMFIHSYAAQELKDRLVWKTGGHAADITAHNFGLPGAVRDCFLYFSPDEEQQAAVLIQENGISAPFIVIEPGTNRDWFGDLRAWPMDRWRGVIAQLRQQYPDHQIVQVGLPATELMDGVIDLRGKTSFRQVGLIMKRARLFIGTEGGLMHVARAVKVPSLILWGGVTLPELAGYAPYHTIICKNVACAPCGHQGWCNNNHICMKNIVVDEVVVAARQMLDQPA